MLLTSEEESQERDSQTLEGDELDDHEEYLNNDGLLQFQSQEQRQQHLLHFLAAGFWNEEKKEYKILILDYMEKKHILFLKRMYSI